ncbi:MAG: Ldh family oxidoreductase [Pelagibacterales bacterium]|jgi:(2R)-3-sulfolactate dehydrogenase (NADP+)|nr:Ldh family oxidoreductase [Pelagibacterales bacterium]MBL6861792.1 Ldh family oxidoreductase [Pelagibacterales bacterium]
MDAQLTKNDAFELAKKTLMACGASEDNALPLANGIVAAELEGIKSHGFHYLPIYCLHLQCQKVKGLATPSINSRSPVAFTVDADNGFAHRAITLGFKDLIPAAKENGIASLAISNSYNCGVLGYHTQTLAREKLIGIGFTNAPASIAPVGGIKPVVGTNPISVAVYNKGSIKILIDQSASVVAKSEISVRAKSGEAIPTGWAFGPDGENTTDPSIALKGTMAPTGGYKGFGIGLFVEIMTACLTGANLGTEASSFADDKGGPPGTGQFFIAINPEKYSQGFEEKITSLINNIESQDGSRVPGSKRIANANANADIPINIKEDLYNKIISLQG